MEGNIELTTLGKTITTLMTVNDTNSSSSNDEFVFEDPAQRLVVAITFIIVSIVGTIGNMLVIAAVAVSRKLRTITNVFVINLAVADLLTSLSIPWNAVALISRNGWPLHPYICTLAGAIMYLCIVASLYSLASVAINRFILVTKNHRVYQKIFTKVNLVIWIILIWVLSFILVVFLPVINIGGLGYNEKYSICGQSSSHPRDDTYQLVQAIGSFPIPLTIISYSYIKIFLHVRNHVRVMSIHRPGLESNQTDSTVAESIAQTPQQGDQQTTKQKENGHLSTTQSCNATPSMLDVELNVKESKTSQIDQTSSEGRNDNINTNNNKDGVLSRDAQSKAKSQRGASFNRRQLQITKNMFVVVCAFFVCIAPFFVCLFFDDSDPFVPYASAIVLCNACINPVIYATKHPVFKAVMNAMIRCRFNDIPEPVRMVHRLTIKR